MAITPVGGELETSYRLLRRSFILYGDIPYEDNMKLVFLRNEGISFILRTIYVAVLKYMFIGILPWGIISIGDELKLVTLSGML